MAEALSADVVHRDDYKGSGADASYAKACRAVLLDRKPLILDETHSTFERRRLAHELAREFGVKIVVVNLTADAQTCIARAVERERRRDNGMSRERVTAAIMKTGNSMKSQPLDEDAKKLGDDFQGYQSIVSVDGNKPWTDVAAQLSNDVVPKIRACLAPTAGRAAVDYYFGAPAELLLALPTAKECESTGTAHLDRVVAANTDGFQSERLPRLFGGAVLLASGSMELLRLAACRLLKVDPEVAPKPLGHKRVRSLIAGALAAVDAKDRRGVLKSTDDKLVLNVEAPLGRGSISGTVVRDAIVAAVGSQDPQLAADAYQHLEFESFLRCAMPEVKMLFGSYQDVAPGGKINWHNDKAPFDYRLILQYADPGAEFVARVDVARP